MKFENWLEFAALTDRRAWSSLLPRQLNVPARKEPSRQFVRVGSPWQREFHLRTNVKAHVIRQYFRLIACLFVLSVCLLCSLIFTVSLTLMSTSSFSGERSLMVGGERSSVWIWTSLNDATEESSSVWSEGKFPSSWPSVWVCKISHAARRRSILLGFVIAGDGLEWKQLLIRTRKAKLSVNIICVDVIECVTV